MAQLYPGVIKAVISGDTVVVMGADASKGPPPEKLLSLTGISAPRMGNKTTPDAVRGSLKTAPAQQRLSVCACNHPPRAP